MRTNQRLSYIWLLVPVLLFAGVQIFALADSTVPASTASPNTASPNTMGMEFKAAAKSHADVVISDRASILKSIGAKDFRTGGCHIIDCAAPPPGCTYQNPTFDANGCPTSCGTLVCDPNGGN